MASVWAPLNLSTVMVPGDDRLRHFIKPITSSETAASSFTLSDDDIANMIITINGWGIEKESIEVVTARKSGNILGRTSLTDLSITWNYAIDDVDYIKQASASGQRFLIVEVYDEGAFSGGSYTNAKIVNAAIASFGTYSDDRDNGKVTTFSVTAPQEDVVPKTNITLP